MISKTMFVGIAIGMLIAIFIPAIPSKIKSVTGV